MPQPQTKFEITVEKLVYGGDGLSRLDGRVVLTPFVLPQERVLVEVLTGKPDLLRSRLLEVMQPSVERVIPPCSYFTSCGGCHYQHLPYEAQLSAKRSILAEVLRRVGKIDAPAEIEIVAGEPWEYRNRTQFHLNAGQIGYLEAGSHRLCPVRSCPISSPTINRTLGILREMMRDSRWPRFIQSLEVFTNETDVQLNVLDSKRPVARRFFDWCAERIPGWATGALEYAAGDVTYRVGSRSFFQVNRCLVERLVEVALEGLEGETAVDLYAGVGLFSIPLARRFREVIAVESGGNAVRDLQFNAERAAAPVTAAQGTAEEFLHHLEKAPDFLLLDPPRAGLGKRVTQRLTALGPPRMTIVSCDPATLARDLSALLTAGYQVERMILIDLFPQTFHLETIVRLRKDGPAGPSRAA